MLFVLWEKYDLLATYGAYEVLIACPRRFLVSVAGAGPLVSTPGGPPCAVDHYPIGQEDVGALLPDVLIVPDGDFAADGSSVLDAWVRELLQQNQGGLVVRVGPRAPTGQSPTEAFRGLPPERLLKSVGGADLAAYLVEELAGTSARVAAEETVEYRGHNPFEATPPPPNIPEDVFRDCNPDGKTNPIELGVFLFEGFEMLDTFGPMAAFVAANDIYAEQHPEKDEPLFRFTYYAQNSLVRSSCGPLFQAGRLLDEPPLLDWLLVPGGIGTLAERHNPVGRGWARSAAERAALVMTVCTGSGYIADLGLLNGRRATTNKLANDLIASWAPGVRWRPEARWIRDGKYWTSSGVAAGTDQALAVLAAELCGTALADVCAHRMGWHHRVSDGERDCFDARGAWRLETFVVNILFRALYSWLPQNLRPNVATVNSYLA